MYKKYVSTHSVFCITVLSHICIKVFWKTPNYIESQKRAYKWNNHKPDNFVRHRQRPNAWKDSPSFVKQDDKYNIYIKIKYDPDPR